ncbi:MAG: serine/threonine protein kinase [Deltaproteobacteria bacterium]|nr:serine/threonine protein kinase [Deltaproteobacteria bacterium]
MRTCPRCKLKYLDSFEKCPADGAALSSVAATDPMFGRVLGGRYRLESRIGEGGMGWVYRATRTTDDTQVAVKLLIARSDERGREHRERFRREVGMLGRLRHPNVVSMLDAGEENGQAYMVMEYLQGRTLHDVVPAGGVPVRAAADIIQEVCEGLEAAHRAGLVHRDLKPENVFIARQATGVHVVKIIDFGLARATDVDEESRLTQQGKVVGSAGYIAPEHILGSRDFTPASDIYAVGAVLFFMLAGRRPYEGDSVGAVMEAQVKERLPPLGLPQGHPSLVLEPVIRRAMSRQLDRRFPSTRDLGRTVEELLRASRGDRPITTEIEGLTVIRQVRRLGRSWVPQVAAATAGAGIGFGLLGLAWWLLR